jgi:uncharacterized protein DUF2252
LFQRLCLSIIGLSFIIGSQSWAGQTLELASPSLSLSDVPYQFDQTKLDVAKDSFHFMRSFVDYFYLLIAQNQDRLGTASSFKDFSGWCVGDAHAENFGFVMQKKGNSVFIMNDLDDAGPCPVAYDLFRLMSSSQLYTPNARNEDILSAYLAGVQGDTYSMPAAVGALYKDSQKKGANPHPKKVDGNQLVRDQGSQELERGTLKDLQKTLNGFMSGLTLLDAFKTAKVGGGSGGLTRYELLVQIGPRLLHLELKEEVRPAVYPVATAPIPATSARIAKALEVEQGPQTLPFYGVVQFQGLDMLVRPIFWGNAGVSLDKNSEDDNLSIIYYEAYVLGTLHRKSLNDSAKYVSLMKGTPVSAWNQDVAAMAAFMNKKFKTLTH